ncbi:MULTISPECIES: magnesium/cobalt transporter CorA [Gracilibacillus]|uniref:magnesium/cobalt transporter CorA n=1 Tax=Gracilibacillus TaxID=74385 RepID=UPI0008255548|nr:MULTISPECIES: magnesium/cobalt transporter CorA [Gracilibacillus]
MAVFIRYQTTSGEWQETTKEKDIPLDASFVWYDFVQPTKEENQLLSTSFHFNPLEIEDTVKTITRPKFKSYQDYQFLACQAIDGHDYTAKAINIFMKQHFLVTYRQDQQGGLSNLEQVLKSFDQISLTPTDAALIILDQVVDNYFDYVYQVEDDVFSFEERHVDVTISKDLMDDVFRIRSVIIRLKRVLHPMFELIDGLKQEEDFAQPDKQQAYLHHIEDHMIKQMNMIKAAQEMTGDIRDNYASINSYRMNRVMQLLTLVSAIFLPLSLITGFYGMNFQYMPGVNWSYGYITIVAAILIISALLILYFKRKNWF